MQTLSNESRPGEARKQIYSSLPAGPEPEEGETRSWGQAVGRLRQEAGWSLPLRHSDHHHNLSLLSLSPELLENKWEWLPLPLSFIKLKAVKRNGDSFENLSIAIATNKK